MYYKLYSIQLNDKKFLNTKKYAITPYIENRFLTENDIYQHFKSIGSIDIVFLNEKDMDSSNHIIDWNACCHMDVAYSILQNDQDSILGEEEYNSHIIIVTTIEIFQLCYRYYRIKCCTDDEILTTNEEMNKH